MTNRNLAFVGSALLAGGLFIPIITLPIVGGVNLFNNGSNVPALALLALAALTAALALKERLRETIWPGAAAAIVLTYLFVRLQYALSTMRAELERGLDGNPFAGIARTAAQTIQLQWGWLVLGAGAGLILYAGFNARRGHVEEEEAPGDHVGRYVAIASILLLLVGPGLDAYRSFAGGQTPPAPTASASERPSLDDPIRGSPTPARASREEADYIAQNLRLYDFNARYFESYEGRRPGVRFKIKNNGPRTLNRVKVRVVFMDGDGNPIGEEEYDPVFVSEYSFGDNDTPLRPNYIWQQEPNRFFTASSIPSEWAEGRATATITDIEFAPAEGEGR
jgi:hypothetical protein